MGVLNVTPDSFSDGGRFLLPTDAISHGRQMIGDGADLIDVGGESTRPGAEPVDEAEELRRVLPVIEALSPLVRVSVDTQKPEVARRAVRAGASLINDVSATLLHVAAEQGVGWVAMHMQGTPATMQADPRYEDVVTEVFASLIDHAQRAREAGINEVWVDPGIGFGKTTGHNLSLLKHLPQLVSTARDVGANVAVGTSRKRFLGGFGSIDGKDLAPEDRIEASIATAVWALASGVRMVRVHDVRASVQAARLVSEETLGAVAA
jgi:dihydropteroate synthase